MTPGYKLVVNGEDITPAVNGRLVRLTLTDESGDSADQLDITLSDHDGALAIPPRNASIECWIGWKGDLVYKGVFVVDEVSYSGPPDTLTLRARSADFKGPFKLKRQQSWHELSLGDLITTIANRSDLTPVIAPELASKWVEHIDQTNESDLNLLTRLGKQYGAVATTKNGRLLFMPAGKGKTASGASIESVTVYRQDGDQFSYSQNDRENDYTGVETRWTNTDTGEQVTVVAGGADNPRRMRYLHASETDAAEAAQSEWLKLNRSGSQLSVDFAEGRPYLYPETPVKVVGFKVDIESTPWVITRVTHSLDDKGFTTKAELDVSSD